MKGISVAEAASQLGVSTDSVRRAVERGELPAFRLGHRVVIDGDQLDVEVRAATTGPRERRMYANRSGTAANDEERRQMALAALDHEARTDPGSAAIRQRVKDRLRRAGR